MILKLTNGAALQNKAKFSTGGADWSGGTYRGAVFAGSVTVTVDISACIAEAEYALGRTI
jgi:hypothetical protein